MNCYKWGTFKRSVSADTVGRTLEAIEKRDGTVTSQAFLDESRPEESATHSLFEWDDSIAAERYRLAQAGTIIRDLKIEIVTEEQEPEQVSLSFSEEPKDERTVTAYMNITPGRHEVKQSVNVHDAMSNPEYRKIVLDHAMDELETFKAKYKALTELAEVFTAIEDVKARIAV